MELDIVHQLPSSISTDPQRFDDDAEPERSTRCSDGDGQSAKLAA